MLTFYQLPEVDVHLLRGLTLKGKAMQVVWVWRYRCVDEDPAWRLRTPGGTDLTVARVRLVIWGDKELVNALFHHPGKLKKRGRWSDIPLRVYAVLGKLLVPLGRAGSL